MKEKAVKLSHNTVVLFPRIYRFITETTFSRQQTINIKVFLTSSVSIFLLLLIFFEGVILYHQLGHQKYLAQERVQIEKEVVYWKGISAKYKGYRDVYYRLASLYYRLGDSTASRMYVQKALELDPNFSDGSVLGAKVGIRE